MVEDCNHPYERITREFGNLMIGELEANRRKGGREGWLNCTPMQLLLEVYYHTGKLQKAIMDKDENLVKEYSADVANMAMMVLDSYSGVIEKPELIEEKYFPNTEWTEKIVKEL